MRGAESVVRGQQVYLVDTPGLGDSKRSIAELAERSVLTSPAYIYVIKYDNLEEKRDSKTFKRMYKKDESKYLLFILDPHGEPKLSYMVRDSEDEISLYGISLQMYTGCYQWCSQDA